ncbi:hypothetical protein E8E11_011816 [Didymella keratinophila]|nr:hypothetical protein E8E11_011816 [Didymella keratinophila]
MDEDEFYALQVALGLKRRKVIFGHYIASVREPDNTFSCADDSVVNRITRQQFLTNPQVSNGQHFQVYLLTYVRDDAGRNMPAAIPEKWIKELVRLDASKEKDKPVIHPTVEPARSKQPDQAGRPSKRRAAGQSTQQGTKQKRSKRS